MKHWKKWATLLYLCLALLCITGKVNAAEVVKSGTCGENLT